MMMAYKAHLSKSLWMVSSFPDSDFCNFQQDVVCNLAASLFCHTSGHKKAISHLIMTLREVREDE